MIDFRKAMTHCPLVAILRGIKPEHAAAIGDRLIETGFTMIEVPLNSPDPLRTIEILAHRLGSRALVGAGTVLNAHQVDEVKAAGGTLVVSPNCDDAVIARTKQAGLVSIPGVATPTEAFVALSAGADALKAFPAETLPPAAIKAWLAVLPAGTEILPVGGIGKDNMGGYWKAGARGFGLGSSLYKPGDPPDAVHASALRLIAALTAVRG